MSKLIVNNKLHCSLTKPLIHAIKIFRRRFCLLEFYWSFFSVSFGKFSVVTIVRLMESSLFNPKFDSFIRIISLLMKKKKKTITFWKNIKRYAICSKIECKSVIIQDISIVVNMWKNPEDNTKHGNNVTPWNAWAIPLT